MKMTEILEKDKEHLLTALTEAASAEKAIRVLENETDKLLLRYNEKCDSERVRDSAAYMMQAVRLSLPLLDSVGRTKVWESGNDDEEVKRKVSIPAILLTLLGIALVAFALFPYVMSSLPITGDEARNEFMTHCASAVAGLIFLYLAGTLSAKPKKIRRKDQHVEIRIDPDRVYRNFRTTIVSVDQSLEEIAAHERWSKREQAGNIDGRPATTPELELFSDLLAAAYSGDPEYALEKIEAIKYYLHKQQIEVIDYSEETAQYFDLMPGTAAGTIRPAMVANGGLLRKGLASTGR